MKNSMTPRERWMAVLERKTPDRIPMDYWATKEASDKLKKHLGCNTDDELYKKLSIDKPVPVEPEYKGKPYPHDEDMYGCKYADVSYATGVYRECVFHPLADFTTVEAIEAQYTWPVVDWFDYSKIPRQTTGKEDRPFCSSASEPFLTYKFLRGDEQAFMDLILNPDVVEYCLGKLFGFCMENAARIYEQIPGKITFSYISEDMGSESGLMISPDHIRHFLMPHMKRMIDLVHQAGVYVFHHNDGSIRKILPDLIDAKIDILNPIQWKCVNMDREGLKKDFGEKVIFHGGVDNQFILPFGSIADVRREVEDNIRILGAGGGYILAPCHNIQAVTPP